MGYGIKPIGYWAGKRHFTWTWQEGATHGQLYRAMGIWEELLNVSFTRTDKGSNADFIVKTRQSTCGYENDLKLLSLRGTETLGTTLHEIGHVLGLSHEHDRPDSRVSYYEANDKSGFGLLGAKLRGRKLQSYGAYDPASIMQYPESSYQSKTAPSAGDVAAVKAINGW